MLEPTPLAIVLAALNAERSIHRGPEPVQGHAKRNEKHRPDGKVASEEARGRDQSARQAQFGQERGGNLRREGRNDLLHDARFPGRQEASARRFPRRNQPGQQLGEFHRATILHSQGTLSRRPPRTPAWPLSFRRGDPLIFGGSRRYRACGAIYGAPQPWPPRRPSRAMAQKNWTRGWNWRRTPIDRNGSPGSTAGLEPIRLSPSKLTRPSRTKGDSGAPTRPRLDRKGAI